MGGATDDATGRLTSTGKTGDVSSASRDTTGANGPESRCTVCSLRFGVGLNSVRDYFQKQTRKAYASPVMPCVRYDVGRYVVTGDLLGPDLGIQATQVAVRCW